MPNTLGQRDGYKMCVSTESFNTVITLTHFIYFWATQVMCRRRSQTVPIPEERKKNQSYFCTIPPFKNKHFCYFHQSSFFFVEFWGTSFAQIGSRSVSLSWIKTELPSTFFQVLGKDESKDGAGSDRDSIILTGLLLKCVLINPTIKLFREPWQKP